jgi:hypothetical protein
LVATRPGQNGAAGVGVEVAAEVAGLFGREESDEHDRLQQRADGRAGGKTGLPPRVLKARGNG